MVEEVLYTQSTALQLKNVITRALHCVGESEQTLLAITL